MTKLLHPADYITLTFARSIRNHERVFHGVASPIPAVAIRLAQATTAPQATYLSIAGKVNAQPTIFSIYSTAGENLRTGAIAPFSLSDIFDLSARGQLDVAFLSGAQIDGEGRLNLSAIGSFDRPKVRLPGGAGSAALLPTVKRGILWKSSHDKRTLVEELDVITAAGNTELVVTPLCVFKRNKENNKLQVVTVFPTSTFAEVVEKTGFGVEKHPAYGEFIEPTEREWELLQQIDPEETRKVEFTS